jgi:hypothetical protein
VVLPVRGRRSICLSLAGVAQLAAALSRRVAGGRLPVEVWIDDSDLVRRESLREPLLVHGQPVELQLQEDYLAYGPEPQPILPPPGEVTKLSTLAARFR